MMIQKKLFKDKDELESSMINYIKLFKKNNFSKKNSNIDDLNFISEKIIPNKIDYYYSNVVARASKTMNNCRIEKTNMKLTSNNH